MNREEEIKLVEEVKEKYPITMLQVMNMIHHSEDSKEKVLFVAAKIVKDTYIDTGIEPSEDIMQVKEEVIEHWDNNRPEEEEIAEIEHRFKVKAYIHDNDLDWVIDLMMDKVKEQGLSIDPDLIESFLYDTSGDIETIRDFAKTDLEIVLAIYNHWFMINYTI